MDRMMKDLASSYLVWEGTDGNYVCTFCSNYSLLYNAFHEKTACIWSFQQCHEIPVVLDKCTELGFTNHIVIDKHVNSALS